MPPLTTSETRYIFIGGIHRSGTSLMHQCLRSHPMISGFHDTGVTEDEGQHLQSILPRGGIFGGPGRFARHPDAHMTESHPLACAETAEKLLEAWSPYWDLEKPFRVEKTPITLVRTRLMQALFPRSYFIIMVRHPVSAILSTYNVYASHGVYDLTFADLLRNWLAGYETLFADAPHLRHLHILKYEDFAARPQEELDRIYAVLGLPSHPLSEEVHADVNGRYWQLWRTVGEDPKHKPHYEEALALEEQIRSYGYSLIDESVCDPIAMPETA